MCENNRNARFKLFPHPFSDYDENNTGCNYPFTLAEISMMEMSGKIRSKKDWVEKYKNPEIIEKWTKEAKDQGMSEIQVKYVLDQLEFYEKIRKDKMEPAFNHEIWQSNELIPSELRDELLKCVSKLEKIPEEDKDWHPGSDEKVLNLVHPSLYCCVYNESKKVKMENGTPVAELVNPPVVHNDSVHVSDKYQWLPSEFSVEADGSVNIKSYINNLHVENQDMYKVIGKIFEKFVPLFNETLTSYNMYLPRPVSTNITWYGHRKSKRPRLEVENERAEEAEEPGDDDDDDDDDDGVDDNYKTFETHEFIPIEPKPFEMPNFDTYLAKDEIIDLKDANLQVIVKISSIELTPKKPKYDGGVWHVEGMVNEHIIATGIYYYAMENITESKLLFRQAVSEPDYEQNDDEGIKRVYGLENGGSLSQYLGNVVAEEGKCIVFPNVYQHQVSPFELIDKTKPGTRKIVVFFLVDPSEQIVSTADILPQQENWLEPTVNAFKLFPNVDSQVLKDLIYTMTLDEAKNHRLKLMEERKTYNDEEFNQFVREFSLCEH